MCDNSVLIVSVAAMALVWMAAEHAGVDEAGRGCLAGDVCAAAVMLPAGVSLPKLNDSKKLTEKTRDALAIDIKAQAMAWCVGHASVAEIAQWNILHAALLAMHRAVRGLAVLPEKVWVDGNRIPPDLGVPAEAVIQGDGRIMQIAAASILAKTARDAQMYELAQKHPEYGFERHKGYGTPEHLNALRRYGVLPEHRRAFAPVKALLASS